MTAEELKRLLGLVPLEREGGFFAETYRTPEVVPAGILERGRPASAPSPPRSTTS